MTKRLFSNGLWFDDQAEQAAQFYTAALPNSKMGDIVLYGKEGHEIHGGKEGTAHAQFGLSGQKFMAMDSTDAGHKFSFNEAISIIINCDTQDEIDFYWSRLVAEGEESDCGWLKDKFGVSWQVDYTGLTKMLKDTDEKKVQRVTKSFLQMKKYDVEKLKAAFEGRVS